MYEASSVVVSLIYNKIMQEQFRRLGELRDPSIIYVTDLVGCTHKFHMRKQFPELTLVFEPMTVLGDIAHLGLEKILVDSGFEVEVEVSGTFNIEGRSYLLKGRVDAVNRDQRIVLEIKTARSSSGVPREHHVRQLNLYLNLMDFDKGILLYVAPDKLVEFTIPRQVIKLESEIEDLINNRYRPRYEWECRFCTYGKICPFQRQS